MMYGLSKIYSYLLSPIVYSARPAVGMSTELRTAPPRAKIFIINDSYSNRLTLRYWVVGSY